jgi:hypothetical protein
MKPIVLVLLLMAMTACVSPEESGVKAIVGARLIAAPGRAPVDYSVVVIEKGKIREVGPESSTPVPKGAELTRGMGMTVEPLPGGGPIEAGKPADLVLKGSTDRVMKAGEWVR